MREWEETNKEHRSQYFQDNKLHFQEIVKQWNLANPEKRRKIRRNNYEAHHSERLEYAKERNARPEIKEKKNEARRLKTVEKNRALAQDAQNDLMQYAIEGPLGGERWTDETSNAYAAKFKELGIIRTSPNKCICLKCNREFVVSKDKSDALAVLKVRLATKKSPCPWCGDDPVGGRLVVQKSKPEEEIFQKYDTFTIRNYRPEWMNGLELDLYDSSNKIAVEFNGIKWHSDYLRKDCITKHKRKADLCEANGVQLIQIYENEWVNSKEIVLDKLDAIFHVNMERKFARKLELRELNDRRGRALAGRFMDANHIQGAASCQWCVGLFEGDEPVAVCSFKYGTAYATGGQSAGTEKYWELNRYATRLHTSVVGGISRCVKAFARSHLDVHKIVSFADRRWTCPKRSAYASSGFVEVGRCEPNYMYTDLDPRHGLRSKQYMRKSSIEDRAKKDPDGPEARVFDWDKTETEMSRELGFYRIYDAGKIRYEMSI